MDRPVPDAAVCARALEALLGMLWPRRRRATAAALLPTAASSEIAQLGPVVSAYRASPARLERPYVIVWEFLARRGKERRFEEAYGSAGEWVRLFKQAPGYLGTQLRRDAQ